MLTATKLKRTKNGNIFGYTLSDIQKELTQNQWLEFNEWLKGQTVGIYHEETFIFTIDYEMFRKGLPPLD